MTAAIGSHSTKGKMMSNPQNPNDPNQQLGDAQAGSQPQETAQPGSQQAGPAQSDHSTNTYGHDPYDQGDYQQGAYQQATYQQGTYQQGTHPQAASYQQQGVAYPQQGVAYPQQAGYSQTGLGEKGFLRSLFDFRFDSFIAVRWAGIIYIIAIIVAALSWLATIVGGIVTGAAAGAAASVFNDGPSFSVMPLILSILFGWIVPALWVIAARLVLELIVANVKTAQNTKTIADSVSR